MDLIKSNFDKFVDISKSVKLLGISFKKTHLISVDTTGIYNDEFNVKRYIMVVFDFFIMNISLLWLYLFYKFDSLYKLIDNEFLPQNFKAILIGVMFLLTFSIAIRFDFLMAEWNQKLSLLKLLYYFQEDIISKQGLTQSNKMKLSILAKMVEIIFLKGFVPLIGISLSLGFVYIAIRSNKIVIQLFIPLFIYGVWLVASTYAVVGSIALIGIYYIKLMFDQINHQFEIIYKQSTKYITIRSQRNLFLLMKKHDSIAYYVYNTNFLSRTICVFFIALAFDLIMPLNLYLKANDSITKIFYFIHLITEFSFGFSIAYFLSLQIESAHKPYKIIYKILRKQKFNFYFQWKVIRYIFQL